MSSVSFQPLYSIILVVNLALWKYVFLIQGGTSFYVWVAQNHLFCCITNYTQLFLTSSFQSPACHRDHWIPMCHPLLCISFPLLPVANLNSDFQTRSYVTTYDALPNSPEHSRLSWPWISMVAITVKVLTTLLNVFQTRLAMCLFLKIKIMFSPSS